MKHEAKVLKNGKYHFQTIRELYPHYDFADLAKHKAIVLVPYQVSVMSIFEYYRMGIPIFAPSLTLLVELQTRMTLLHELSWNCVFGRCNEKSAISSAEGSSHKYDPNDIFNKESMKHWLNYSDFYQMPHILYYNNWNDLLDKIEKTDFVDVSSRMIDENKKILVELKKKWLGVIAKAFPMRKKNSKKIFSTWEEAMKNYYPNANDVIQKC